MVMAVGIRKPNARTGCVPVMKAIAWQNLAPHAVDDKNN